MRKEKEVKQVLTPILWPLHPFLQKLKKRAKEGKFYMFISMLKQLIVNIYFVKALEQILGYAKFMKDLLTKMRIISFEFFVIWHYSVIASRSHVEKK